MSHPVNDAYLEECYESFKSSEDGSERANIIGSMRAEGFSEHADNLEASWYKERTAWLVAVGTREEEVLEDEEGEFFMDVDEQGTPGDDYEVRDVKHRVPGYLRIEKIKR